MVTHQYGWEGGAKIGSHSVIKHKIVRDYIKAYVATLTANISIDHFRLALVDGFAGGGIYEADWDGSTIYGSPFAMLEACEEAQIAGQILRKKPFKLNTRFYFVEKTKAAHTLLLNTLKAREYGHRVNNGSDIQLFCDDFLKCCDQIILDIRSHSPSARSIFLLDQYGYSEVPKETIQKIFTQLPHAEVILNFNIDSLLNYLNKENLLNFHKKTGFRIDGLLESRMWDKDARPSEWRLAAQAILHNDLVSGCFPDGNGHHTTFYIRAEGGHGDYWLVHLSRNLTARNVMVDIHWRHGNHFAHYGGPGFDMYCLRGFNPKAEADLFGFDQDARALSQKALKEQIPQLIFDHHAQGITYRELLAQQANYTPARDQDIRLMLCDPDLRQDLIVLTPKGKQRRNATAPQNEDIIMPNPQRRLFY
jgi:three-Cys-motif partner protein